MWGTQSSLRLAVGAGEQAAGHQRERGQRGQRVVLLARGQGEEAEDEAGPEEKGESGFAVVVDRAMKCGVVRCARDAAILFSVAKRRVRMWCAMAPGTNAIQGKIQMAASSQKSGMGTWP